MSHYHTPVEECRNATVPELLVDDIQLSAENKDLGECLGKPMKAKNPVREILGDN